jgi:splicing factor 3B subunit 2
MAATKMSKNQMRRAKKKEQKKAQTETAAKPEDEVKEEPEDEGDAKIKDEPATVVAEAPPSDAELDEDPTFAMYKDIFSKFGVSLDADEVAKEANAGNQGTVFFDEDDDIPDEDEAAGPVKLSKKKRKQLNKLSVAELKALVRIPEVVEWQDISSSDPRVLVQIKAQRNVVPVPTHWSLKREYLSSKRGIEKAAFSPPRFHCRDGYRRDARCRPREAGRADAQAEAARARRAQNGLPRHRLPEALRRLLSLPDQARAHSLR